MSRNIVLFLLSLTWAGCETKPTAVAGDSCTANVDPNDSVHACSGDALLYCVCDNYVDNNCPDQQGTWVVQDILCSCSEWEEGNCPIE